MEYVSAKVTAVSFEKYMKTVSMLENHRLISNAIKMMKKKQTKIIQ